MNPESELNDDFEQAVDLDDERDNRAGELQGFAPSTAPLASHVGTRVTYGRARAYKNPHARVNERAATSRQLWRLNQLGLLEIRWSRSGDPVSVDQAKKLLAETREQGLW